MKGGEESAAVRLLPLLTERRRIVAVAQRRLRAARRLLDKDRLPAVEPGWGAPAESEPGAGWPGAVRP